MRHPRRSRSVSIGPQSEADAYEALAHRDKHRRENTQEKTIVNPSVDEKSTGDPSYFGVTTSNSASKHLTTGLLPTPSPSDGDLNQSMLGAETALYTPLTPASGSNSVNTSRQSSQARRQDEREEREMFSKLEKPRLRYDVEVVTKLVVYTGKI